MIQSWNWFCTPQLWIQFVDTKIIFFRILMTLYLYLSLLSVTYKHTSSRTSFKRPHSAPKTFYSWDELKVTLYSWNRFISLKGACVYFLNRMHWCPHLVVLGFQRLPPILLNFWHLAVDFIRVLFQDSISELPSLFMKMEWL